MKKLSAVLALSSLLSLPLVARAQTFEIQGQDQSQSANKNQKKPSRTRPQNSSQGLGWGSSIEVGRMARAAQQAMKHGNYAQAASFAERAANAAPRDPKLWFLLGYTSRLAGKQQQSLAAYQRGLQASPGNADGLSGMAQTYAKMGKTDEAKRLLMQVINANPRRQNDLLVAGELYMRTGDMQQGISLLQRAESLKPSAHAELMLAVGYLKLKQPEKAKQMLDLARRRDPKNPAIFRAMANYYREQHDYQAAIKTLKSAPNPSPDVLADLGYTYGLAGEKQPAADAYIKAANAAPQQIGFQLSAAQSLLALGNIDKSKQFIARANAIDANNYRLHAIKGSLAKVEDRPLDAIREYNEAIARLPETVPEGQLYPVQLRLNLADLYRQQGNVQASQQQIQTAEQMVNQMNLQGPARAEFLRVRAGIYTSEEKYPAAEKDLQEAIRLDPNNDLLSLQYANLLWKMKRPGEAKRIYQAILNKDKNNRFALEAMGYLAREVGDNKTAEDYFQRLAKAYPNDYVAYVALGDLYTAIRDFKRANSNYEKAYKNAPSNPIIIANAANAAIEAKNIDLAGNWVDRAKGKMNDDPRVMRERERYLFHKGNYLESARLGYQVIEKLPTNRDAAVYLAYDLYNLGRYDEVLSLSNKYENVLPKEPNFPLLVGHVHKQVNLLDQAVHDYSRAIDRDPKMVEAYVNRGYVHNDLQEPGKSIEDFDAALKLAPNNGVAHLGMSFANLQLRNGKRALDEADQAQKLLGESGATHLARATAYRQMRLLNQAEKEFQAALKYAPDDLKLHMALADAQYHAHHYPQALETLNAALRLSPDDPVIYSQMAHAYAELHDREKTLQYVQAAERSGQSSSQILLNTGDALLALGDQQGAMERFARALNAPDANKVKTRLLIAKLFARDGRDADAKQQIALGFSEARIGESSPVTADDMIQAANIFLSMNDFDLAEGYFKRAKAAGAADEVVAIGLANTYLAQGRTQDAQIQLAGLGNPVEFNQNYDYMLAMGSLYRQQHDMRSALATFARANLVSGDSDVAEKQMEQVAAAEGLRVTPKLSVGSDFTMNGIFEDATIYNLDRQIFAVTTPGLLPNPRSSLETRWLNSFRYHQPGLPTVSGFFQIRNARGQVSIPSEFLIINRNTYDYSVNGALNPILKVGGLAMQFNTGLQYTWRRDRESPRDMNQNLFRQFVYMSSNTLFDWISIRGSAFHESGPFTYKPFTSRDLGASLEFIVGRPWGNTQLLTGYKVRDLQFNPIIREYFSTTTSIGVQHQFGKAFKLAVLGDYIRSWRAQNNLSYIAQAMRPGGEFRWNVNDRWSVEGNFTYARGMGFHDYDNVQNSFLINYVRPFRRTLQDGAEEVPVSYPLSFSVGIQSASYFNFSGTGNSTVLRPVFRLSIF